MLRKTSIAVLLLCLPAFGFDYDEAVDGDLSNDHLNPTPLTIALGTNRLVGTVASFSSGYITFIVPPGAATGSIVLDYPDIIDASVSIDDELCKSDIKTNRTQESSLSQRGGHHRSLWDVKGI